MVLGCFRPGGAKFTSSDCRTFWYICPAVWYIAHGLFWYNVPMAIKYNIAVNQCDQCEHRWLPESPLVQSVRCPSRKCRSTAWNKSWTAPAKAEAVLEAFSSTQPASTLPQLAAASASLPQRPQMVPRCPRHRLPMVRNDETGIWACRITKCRQRADDETVKLAYETADFASI